jgi:hypothetical protein
MAISVEQIAERLNITIEQATAIKGIIKGTIDPTTVKSVQNWISQCYNMPYKVELKLCAINDILEGFGVEYISSVNDDYSEVYGLDYVNLGDTYTPTVIFDHNSRKWRFTSWGDIVESNQNFYE